MELEQMPQPGPGMCGSDREVFERVWRRVMETGGGESPVEVVPAEEAALPAPAQPLPAPAVPARCSSISPRISQRRRRSIRPGRLLKSCLHGI